MYLKCTAKKVLFQKIDTTDFMSDHSPGEEHHVIHVTCLISAPSPDVLEDVVKVFHNGVSYDDMMNEVKGHRCKK